MDTFVDSFVSYQRELMSPGPLGLRGSGGASFRASDSLDRRFSQSSAPGDFISNSGSFITPPSADSAVLPIAPSPTPTMSAAPALGEDSKIFVGESRPKVDQAQNFQGTTLSSAPVDLPGDPNPMYFDPSPQGGYTPVDLGTQSHVVSNFSDPRQLPPPHAQQAPAMPQMAQGAPQPQPQQQQAQIPHNHPPQQQQVHIGAPQDYAVAHVMRDAPVIKREPPHYAAGMDNAGQFMRFKLAPSVQSNMAYPPMVVMQHPPNGHHPGYPQMRAPYYEGNPGMYGMPDQIVTPPHMQPAPYGVPAQFAASISTTAFAPEPDEIAPPDSKRRKVNRAAGDEDDEDGQSAANSGSNGDSDDELTPADVAALEAEFNNPAAGPDETDQDLIMYTNIDPVKVEQIQRERGTPGVPLLELPDGPARHQVKEFNILPITKLKLNYRPCNSHYIVINLLCDRRMRRPESVIFLMSISAKRMVDERSSDIEVENLKISKEMVQGRTKGFKFHLLFTLMAGPTPIASVRSEGFFLWSNISQAGFPRHQRERYLEERKQAKRTRRKRV